MLMIMPIHNAMNERIMHKDAKYQVNGWLYFDLLNECEPMLMYYIHDES